MKGYDLSSARIGSTIDGKDVLDIDLMCEVLLDTGDFEDFSDAMDFISFNESYSTPDFKARSVIFENNHGYFTCDEFISEGEIEDVYSIKCLADAFIGWSYHNELCYDYNESILILEDLLKCDAKVADKVLKEVIIPLAKDCSELAPIFIKFNKK